MIFSNYILQKRSESMNNGMTIYETVDDMKVTPKLVGIHTYKQHYSTLIMMILI